MNQILNPCPRCNGTVINFVMSTASGQHFQCAACKWHPRSKMFMTEKEIQDRWNAGIKKREKS